MQDKQLDLASYDGLLLEREGKILHVTLNRPDEMNSLSGDRVMELIRLLQDLVGDTESRVVVITGAGKAFSAGADIALLQEHLTRRAYYTEIVHEVKGLIHALLDCPKPIVAKVNGAAIGLGATIALFSDIIFMADEAVIADAHINVGLVPGDGGTVIWPLLVGLPRAKQFLFTGQRIRGKEAERIGLVNASYPRDQLDEKVVEFAKELEAAPPRILHFTKMALNASLKREVSALLDASFAYEALSAYSNDHEEAVMAWVEKRSPKFTGD